MNDINLLPRLPIANITEFLNSLPCLFILKVAPKASSNAYLLNASASGL